jgi:hypothetical protein
VDASINNKAKALDPTLTEACHAALKLPNPTHTEACHAALKLMAAEKAAEKAAKKAAAVVAAEAKLEARAKREEKGRLKAEAEADAWAENWADAWEWFPLVMRRRGSGERAAVARGRVRESRRRARAAARRGNELKPRSRTSRSCAARTSVRNCARAEECHARDVRRRHSRLAMRLAKTMDGDCF